MSRLGPFDMFESGLRRLRRDLGAAAIPIVLGVATLVVGGISWGIFVADPDNITTTTKHSDTTGLLHRIVYGVLRTVSDFAPSVWNVNEGNHGTDLAAILGAGAFYASVFLIAANVMSETVSRIAARYLYNDHVVIIGDSPLASRLKDVWRRRARQTLQVVAVGHGRPRRGSAQVRSAMDTGLFARFGLGRAASVVVDLGDDVATLALAYDLMGAFAGPHRPTSRHRSRRADWVLVVRDRTLADHFAESLSALMRTAELPAIRYLAPERAVVRRLLASRPLFLDEKARDGLHALVIGWSAAADEMIQAIFQTSLIAGRHWPRVTVLSADPAADRAAFFSTRPGLVDAVDVVFLSVRALDDFEPVARMPEIVTVHWDRALYERDAAAPVNAIFLMDVSPEANDRLAIRLKAIQRMTSRLQGHLFGYDMRFADAADREGPQAFGRTIEGFEAFGLDDGFLDDEVCRTTRRRTLAFALHENYRAASGDPPLPDWDRLSESLRRANGNAADHCLAKLHMLGFDVSGIPPGVIPRLGEADDRALRAALRAAPLTGRVRDLVILEHERWALERRFDGWIYGPTRDNARQIHNLLVAWDALSPEEQSKDCDQIEALLDCLRDSGDPAVVLARESATIVPAKAS